MSQQISASMVNDLRAKTGVGLMDCKKALLETNGNFDAAIELLRKKGMATAARKADRSATEGIVESYIHLGGRVGVLLEINCETDFVAKNDTFKQLAKDICMHIAASSPMYVRREDVPELLVSKETEIAQAQCEGKPAQAIEKIVIGKLDKWYSQICLLEQAFVKNQDQTVQAMIAEKIIQTGENIVVRRFVRYQIGE